jgi:tagatose 6-phosphate kinase
VVKLKVYIHSRAVINMIITVTLNASIDRTMVINNFQTGKINRCDQPLELPGGKGLNVTRALKSLGQNVTATGFIGGKSGEKLEQLMDEEGINYDFLRIAGNTRYCFAILDKQQNTLTEINENGPQISEKEIAGYFNKFSEIISGAKMAVFSGSIPKSLPETVYYDLIMLAKQKGLITVLDASGAALKNGTGAKPYIIKPNQREAEELLGFSLNNTDDLLKAINFLSNYCQIAAITLEDKGCVIGTKSEIYHITPPKITVVNSVGSGDSFLAGLIHSFLLDKPLSEMGARATATGSANAMTDRAGFCRIKDIEDILREVRIEKLL